MRAQPPFGCPTITISSTPDPSREGHGITIAGKLSGSSISAATVVLWQELPGQKSFHKAAHATTDASGKYKFVRHAVTTTRSWYVTAGVAKSITIVQRVKALVTLSASAADVTAGHSVELKGRVAPAHSGERIQVEQLISGKWQVIAQPQLNGSSRFRTARKFSPGQIKLRALLRSDKRNARSASRVLTLSVA